MHIIDVAPIARGIPFPTLSYYAKERLPVGRLVTVTVQNRSIYGVVIACDPVSARKGSIKSATFQTKPIKVIHGNTISQSLVTACQETAAWYRAELPDILDAILPNDWLDIVTEKTIEGNVFETSGFLERGCFGSMEYQEQYIRAEIAEAISARMPIAIICPTTHQCDRWAILLDDHDPIVISSTVSEKKRIERIEELYAETSKPCVLITTPNTLGIVSSLAHKIIVTDESHPTYRDHPNGPFDFRAIIRAYTESEQIPLLWTGFAPSAECLSNSDPSPSFSYEKTFSVENAQNRIHEDSLIERDSLSDEGKKFLKSKVKEGRILVIASKKGFSSITVCQDCSTVVTCPTCGTGLTLMNAKAQPGIRVFSCRHCRSNVAAQDTCASCGSWKLVPRGYGIERMAEILEKVLGAGSVATITNEEKLTRAGKAMIKEWQAGSISVLVGTPGLLDSTDILEPKTTIIASTQSLRAGPALRQNENLARLFSVAETYTTDAVHYFHLPQCRLEEYLMNGDGEEFSASELRERKMLGLPPETVAWQLVGTSADAPDKTDIARAIGQLFPKDSPKITLASKPVRGAFEITITVTVSQETWTSVACRNFPDPIIPGITWKSTRVQPEVL